MKSSVKILIAVGVVLGFIGVSFLAESLVQKLDEPTQAIVDIHHRKEIYEVKKPIGWRIIKNNDPDEVALEHSSNFSTINIISVNKENLDGTFNLSEVTEFF